MKDDHIFEDINRQLDDFKNSLETILPEGARKLLQQAIEQEEQEFIDSNKRVVTRNGYLPKRKIQTGLGQIPIRQSRVRSREGQRFSSSILPPYMRRTPSIEAVIPALYLKGVSTSSFQAALEAILGKNANGLSPTNIVRLKESWEKDYKDWLKRDLSGKRYVYFWADGIYFNVRLSEDRPCVLVVMGALEDGKKELIAIHDGLRRKQTILERSIARHQKQGFKHGSCSCYWRWSLRLLVCFRRRISLY